MSRAPTSGIERDAARKRGARWRSVACSQSAVKPDAAAASARPQAVEGSADQRPSVANVRQVQDRLRDGDSLSDCTFTKALSPCSSLFVFWHKSCPSIHSSFFAEFNFTGSTNLGVYIGLAPRELVSRSRTLTVPVDVRTLDIHEFIAIGHILYRIPGGTDEPLGVPVASTDDSSSCAISS
jgi:hypothetical protein